MATLLLFGPARSAAGEHRATIDAASLRELCDEACRRYGEPFESVLRVSAMWVNGEPAEGDPPLGPSDEVAVVPPVSGGA